MTDDSDAPRLKVEGRITGETMEELRVACESRLETSRTLILDATGVTWADGAGAAMLRRLADGGVVLAGASGFVSALVDDAPQAPVSARDTRRASRRSAGAASALATRAHAAIDADATERDLIAGLRAGDDEAFEALVRRFGSRMLAVARRMLGNEDEARDALQDAFLSAFRAIDSFDGDAQLGTWLHRIVVNASLMRMRSRRRRKEEAIEELLPRFTDEGHFVDSPTSWRSDELLERRETRTMMRRCIERLPERHRAILLMRDIEDLDTGEVAQMLGITANAVKVRLHRARQALRTLVERELACA